MFLLISSTNLLFTPRPFFLPSSFRTQKKFYNIQSVIMSYPPCKSSVSCSSNPQSFPLFLVFCPLCPQVSLDLFVFYSLTTHSSPWLLAEVGILFQSSLMLSPNLLVSVIAFFPAPAPFPHPYMYRFVERFSSCVEFSFPLCSFFTSM